MKYVIDVIINMIINVVACFVQNVFMQDFSWKQA